MTTRGQSLVGLAALIALAAGCADAGPPSEGPVDSAGEAILGGTPATGYPEAALVNIQQNGQTTMGCTGTVIAPRVVLTAAHCVADGDGWQISMPYANGQTAHGSSSATYDWSNSNDQVSPNQHDVGLVFLDTPIDLATYPTIASQKLADGAKIVTLGRVKGGQLSKTAVYQSPQGAVSSGSSYGFNFDYAAPMVLEHGDSGGASYAVGTHSIVAVNSTGDDTTMLIARVDLLSTWIAQQVASHSGGGSGGQGGSGGAGGQGGSGGEGGSDGGGGEGGSDPGGWPPPGGPGWPGGGPGWPGGGPGWPPPGGGPGWPPPPHHCVFVPWMWRWYCW